MNKYTVISIVIMLLITINSGGQTYDLRFGSVSKSGSNYDVQVQIKSSSIFKLAASNITFDFNTSALSTPALLSAQNYSGGFYFDMTVTEPNSGIVSMNITYIFSSDTYASDVPASWTDVGTVRFNIVNSGNNPNLVFRTSGLSPTTIYKISGSTLTLLTAGDLYPNNDPMPVELTDFSAGTINNEVELTWQTQTETNNYGFEIERTSEGKNITKEGNWQRIGFVKGNGTSNIKREYKFADNTITSSGKYYYRLKQIDNDGKYEYTNEVSVSINRAEKFELSQNYPNPFNPETKIKYSVPKASHINLSVYNMLGELVAVLEDSFVEEGFYQTEFNASNLSSGIYIYRLVSDDRNIVRKMNLLK